MLCRFQHGDHLLLLHCSQEFCFHTWAEIRLRKTIGTVWWYWQRRREVIKMVLTHYFKQIERAPMRGIKEREEIWQGSMECSPKEVTIFYRRNHPAGLKPINSETSEQENIRISYLRYMHTYSFAVLKTCCRILKASPSLCLVLQLCRNPGGQSLQRKICPKRVLKPCPGLPVISCHLHRRQCSYQRATSTVSHKEQLGPPEIQTSSESFWSSMLEV